MISKVLQNSQSLEQFFLTVGQNNFDNKQPLVIFMQNLLYYKAFWGKRLRFIFLQNSASAGPAIIVKSWQEATFSHARMEYIHKSFKLRNFRHMKPSLNRFTFKNFWPFLQHKEFILSHRPFFLYVLKKHHFLSYCAQHLCARKKTDFFRIDTEKRIEDSK